MLVKRIVLIALLALVGAACSDGEVDVQGLTDEAAEEFALTGIVVEAEAGATPDDDVDDPDVGGLAIRAEDPDAESNLGDCEPVRDAYIAYYDGDTVFPTEVDTEDEAFPENLEGRRITAMGTIEASATTDEGDEEACVLRVDEMTFAAEADADADDDGGPSGVSGDVEGEGTVGASPEPTATASGESYFPEGVEDTDPIFEGTASPDACEGAKACEEDDGTS